MTAQAPTSSARDKSSSAQSSSLTPTFKTGDIIRGRYEIEAVIGSGGMSTVYRALDHRRVRARARDVHVAIKVVHSASESQADIIELMYREARRLFELSHPNIVQVFDWDMENETHYIIMEYLQGHSLAKLLSERAEPLGYVGSRGLLEAIGSALTFLHDRGMVHCDLKPGNIFLTDAGEVKLLDFGFSHKFDEIAHAEDDPTIYYLDRINAVTPIYASKEMLLGIPPIPADDVFSLAIIAYMIIVGHHPYDRKTVIAAQEAGDTLDIPASLPNSAKEALKAALAEERIDRLKNVDDFIQMLYTKPWWRSVFSR